MPLCRRRILQWAAAAIALALTNSALAQTSYPERPIHLVVGFTAGSATDITARMFADKLSQLWSVPVVVENVPGGGGGVGASRVARATPDGYTMMWGANGALTINPSLLANLSYDPARDFAPISLTLQMASIVAVNNDFPVKSIKDLIALARTQPGKISFGHSQPFPPILGHSHPFSAILTHSQAF